MKLALRLVFFTAMGDIDNVIHKLSDPFIEQLPGFISELLFDFCQWSWINWCDTLDDIDEAYKAKRSDALAEASSMDWS